MASEIEIKVKLSDKELNELRAFLEVEAEFVREETQQETYYKPTFKEITDENGFIWEWFRLRVSEVKSVVTHKKVISESNEGWRQKEEYEFEVSDAEQFDSLANAIGYVVWTKFEKVRRIYNYKRDFEVTIDFIEQLGWFMEIEFRYSDDMDGEEAERVLEKELEAMGLDIANESKYGYPHMVLAAEGKVVLPEIS